MTWEDSAAVWTDCILEAIHNPKAIKLLVSGHLTGQKCYVRLFLHHNRFCIYLVHISLLGKSS